MEGQLVCQTCFAAHKQCLVETGANGRGHLEVLIANSGSAVFCRCMAAIELNAGQVQSAAMLQYA